MKRRDFLKYGLLTGAMAAGAPAWTPAAVKRSATDVVTLGNTGIKLSRLAIGTGTIGYGKSSNQTRKLGIDGLADLFWYGVDNGVNFWDSADQYGSHPHMKRALSNVKREKVVILTKTHANTEAEMKADLDRYRQEIGSDYIDIVLLHAETDPKWPEKRAGAMAVLEAARQKGTIRAHGISCHSLEALKVAAKHPFIQVDLARINPAGLHMDSDPNTVISVLREMKANGKGIVGMKILGQGDLRNKVDDALAFAM